jgi:hypothetical protein
MDLSSFALGFWSPLGPYGGLSRDGMIEMRKREAEIVGWTLWTFQHRTAATLSQWVRLLDGRTAYVMLSDSKYATSSSSNLQYYREYTLLGNEAWQAVPKQISLPHPNEGHTDGCAFVVNRVITKAKLAVDQLFPIQWYSTEQREWRDDISLPTQGEHLIRRGGAAALRPVYALLELRLPYLCQLR